MFEFQSMVVIVYFEYLLLKIDVCLNVVVQAY